MRQYDTYSYARCGFRSYLVIYGARGVPYGHTNAHINTYHIRRHERIEGGLHSNWLGAEGKLVREARQVEGDGKRGKGEEKRGELAGGSTFEDIHLASVEQLRSFWENVVVDRGRDAYCNGPESGRGRDAYRNGHEAGRGDPGVHTVIGKACGDGKRCVHEIP